MKAAVLREVGKPLQIEQVQISKPGPHEVLIRTAAAGLCHSDLHFMQGSYPHPLPAVLGGVYYTTLAGLLAAAMKLLRIGQNASQGLLTDLLLEAPPTIAAAELVPWEEIGWFNPWLDIAAARHETADARMFIS